MRYLKFEDCLNIIEDLSFHQGFYGRLLRDIKELDEEQTKELKEEWESKKFTDDLDFIMYLEG